MSSRPGTLCPTCGKPGRAIGIWLSGVRRIRWVRFRCPQPACTFGYVNFDGQPAKAQPSWMAPAREVW